MIKSSLIIVLLLFMLKGIENIQEKQFIQQNSENFSDGFIIEN